MSKGLEALEKLNHTICLNLNNKTLQFNLDKYENCDCKDIREFCDCYEVIEKELKEYERLKIIEQAQTRGFYFKDYQNNNEIRFSGNTFIRVRNQFVQTKPCYEVKETTLYSCYNPLDYPSPSKKVEDAHFWSWKTHLHFGIDDYGKTWALTREELEK